jgi:hypothetical protein
LRIEDRVGYLLSSIYQLELAAAIEHKKNACDDASVLFIGGAEGARTPDLNTASVALSQLSYSPLWRDRY